MKGLQDVQRIPLAGVERAEWLSLRKQGIGGSDAAGVAGLSRWASPYTVWCDKTGRLPEKEETEAMRLGRDLEEYVAKRWCEETGKDVHRVNAILRNPQYPFALANIDRGVVGEEAGLECKTTSSLNLSVFRGEEFPEQYYTQCVHYMAVTGAKRWYLAVAVLGKGFFTYTLERDEAEIAALMELERAFWDRVTMDIPPELDGSEATEKALTAIYADSVPDTVDLTSFEDSLRDYMEIKASLKRLETLAKQTEADIKEYMKDAERGSVGPFKVTWKTQTRSSFDAKEFAAAHPEIDLSPYYRQTTLRPFRVTTKKESK